MTKAYTELVNEPVKWYKQRYGVGIVVGIDGPEQYIKMIHNLFCSFDFKDNYIKAVPNLIRLSDTFHYFFITEARLAKALNLYFYVRALHDNDAPKFSTWDEETGVYNIIEDEVTAQRLADEATAKFIVEHIEQKTFVKDHSSSLLDSDTKYCLAA